MDTTQTTTEIIIHSINDTIVNRTQTITANTANSNSSLTILEYIEVLIWPLIILILLFKYHKQLTRLMDRIINDSEEIQSSYLGLTAKLRKNVSSINMDEKDPEKLKMELKEKLHQNILDEFKVLSTYFFTKPIEIRIQAATEIGKISQSIPFKDLLNFASSLLPGERIAAFIGIKTHLDLFPNREKEETLPDVINRGLDDSYSRVRFRVVKAIKSSQYLTEIFKEELNRLLLEETNSAVRNEIKKTLSRN